MYFSELMSGRGVGGVQAEAWFLDLHDPSAVEQHDRGFGGGSRPWT